MFVDSGAILRHPIKYIDNNRLNPIKSHPLVLASIQDHTMHFPFGNGEINVSVDTGAILRHPTKYIDNNRLNPICARYAVHALSHIDQ